MADQASLCGGNGVHTKLAGRQAGSRLTRMVDLLPRGTLPVGAGLIALGAGAYAHLAVAGHTLPATDMAALSVLWSIALVLNLGVFLPIEQELTRHVAARTAAGEGVIPVVRRGAMLAAAVLAATLLPLAAAARPLADRLFGGNIAMVEVLACACVALAIASVSRGTLAGLGRFKAYGSQLAADGSLRIIIAGSLGAAGMRSATAFGLILTAAPLLAVVLTLGQLLAGLHPGPALPWTAISWRLGLLVGSMMLAQLIVNAAVVSVRLLSPGYPAVVGALLAAVVLARVPLFLFTSLQTSLLPGLAGAVAEGDQVRFRQLLARGCAIVTVLGIGGGLLATILGPWLTPVLFGVHPLLGHAAFAWLASGTLFYMLAMVLGQGAMAQSHHRDQLLCWVAGVVVLTVITASPGGIVPGEVGLRVVAAYALSSVTVVIALSIALFLRTLGTRRSVARHAAPTRVPLRGR
jgi:O-antigen/teichoic acid export membrane protein